MKGDPYKIHSETEMKRRQRNLNRLRKDRDKERICTNCACHQVCSMFGKIATILINSATFVQGQESRAKIYIAIAELCSSYKAKDTKG